MRSTRRPGVAVKSTLDLCPDLLRSIDACGDSVFVVDEGWTIVHWNPVAEAAFGRSAAEVRGRPCYEVIAGIDGGGREVCRARCEKWALARRGIRVRNFDLRVRPAHDVWVNVSIMPIPDPSGRPLALAHVVRNVDRVKRLEHFVRNIASSAEDILTPRPTNGTHSDPSPVHLTARELEVLDLLAHGARTDAIAERLGISRHTVHNHVAIVLNKLGVHSRAAAVAYAFEHHLA